MPYQVYCFTEPPPSIDTPRYVGVSQHALSRRFQHFATAALPPDHHKNPNSQHYEWLRPLVLSGRFPEQHILETLPDDATRADALAAEGRWITQLHELGCPLLNRAPDQARSWRKDVIRAEDRMRLAAQSERAEPFPLAPGSRDRAAKRAGVTPARISQLRTDPTYCTLANIPLPKDRVAEKRRRALEAEATITPPGKYGSVRIVAERANVSVHDIINFRGDPAYREAAGIPPRRAPLS